MSKREEKYLQLNFASGEIVREVRDGKRILRIPAKTMPGGDFVMSRIKFSKDNVIEKMSTLEDTPAPLGHPFDEEGVMLSATSKKGIQDHYAAAWNENVRWEDEGGPGNLGRVAMDVVIYEDEARGNPRAERVVSAVKKAYAANEPVNTSVGLFAWVQPVAGGNYDYEALIDRFDHNAILLDEPPASTPEEGTGLFVASARGAAQIEMLCFSADSAEPVEEVEPSGLCKDRIIDGVGRMFGLRNREETDMSEDAKQEPEVETPKAESNEPAVTQAAFDEFKTEMKAAFAEALAPLKETSDKQAAAFKADEDSKRAEAAAKVVKAGFMKEEQITDEISTNVLLTMASNVGEPGKAADIEGDKAPAEPDESEDPVGSFDFQARVEAANEGEKN